MKKMLALLVAVAVAVPALVLAENCKEPDKVQLKPGDKVVAQWKGDSWWKARITKITGDSADITYSDGEKGTRKLTDMVRDPW